MSIPVELKDLAQAIARYRFAYLLSTGASGAPRAVAVTPVLHGTLLEISGCGKRTLENLAARPQVGLVWPPQDLASHSLIIDGEARIRGDLVEVTASHAVLHRPAPGAPASAQSKCIRREPGD